MGNCFIRLKFCCQPPEKYGILGANDLKCPKYMACQICETQKIVEIRICIIIHNIHYIFTQKGIDMREDLCSIPVNDVFRPRAGCPVCLMRDMLEDRMATYITGAAMMEPDVREETNRQGFCKTHFDQILARGSRLSVALLLESLLQEVETELFAQNNQNHKKLQEKQEARAHSCFVCNTLETNMHNLIRNTIELWQKDPEFRKLYADQQYICLPHYGLLTGAAKKMHKKTFAPFFADTTRLAKDYLHTLNGDITHFCRMYDYRNKDADWGNSKDAIERAIEYLTARKVEVKQKAEEKNR